MAERVRRTLSEWPKRSAEGEPAGPISGRLTLCWAAVDAGIAVEFQLGLRGADPRRYGGDQAVGELVAVRACVHRAGLSDDSEPCPLFRHGSEVEELPEMGGECWRLLMTESEESLWLFLEGFVRVLCAGWRAPAEGEPDAKHIA